MGKQRLEEKRSTVLHRLILERQKGGTVTGIREVISFDEKEILLYTEEGKLSIKGGELHMKQLDLKNGEMSFRQPELSGQKKRQKRRTLFKKAAALDKKAGKLVDIFWNKM